MIFRMVSKLDEFWGNTDRKTDTQRRSLGQLGKQFKSFILFEPWVFLDTLQTKSSHQQVNKKIQVQCFGNATPLWQLPKDVQRFGPGRPLFEDRFSRCLAVEAQQVQRQAPIADGLLTVAATGGQPLWFAMQKKLYFVREKNMKRWETLSNTHQKRGANVWNAILQCRFITTWGLSSCGGASRKNGSAFRIATFHTVQSDETSHLPSTASRRHAPGVSPQGYVFLCWFIINFSRSNNINNIQKLQVIYFAEAIALRFLLVSDTKMNQNSVISCTPLCFTAGDTLAGYIAWFSHSSWVLSGWSSTLPGGVHYMNFANSTRHINWPYRS